MVEALHLVGVVLLGLADEEAVLVVADGEEGVGEREPLVELLEVEVGDEVDEVAGVDDEAVVLSGEGDGLVEVGLEGLVGAGEVADAAGGEVALALAVAVVGEAEMGVREVEKADGTLQARLDGDAGKIHGCFMSTKDTK